MEDKLPTKTAKIRPLKICKHTVLLSFFALHWYGSCAIVQYFTARESQTMAEEGCEMKVGRYRG